MVARCVTLDQLPTDHPATLGRIDWAALDARESRRLRELGFDEGAHVVILHKAGLVAHDPIAVKIGRMTVAIRAQHASAMQIAP